MINMHWVVLPGESEQDGDHFVSNLHHLTISFTMFSAVESENANTYKYYVDIRTHMIPYNQPSIVFPRYTNYRSIK